MLRVKDFPDWKRPQVEAILAFHQAADGYVRFLNTGKDYGAKRVVTSIAARDLDTMFPSFAEELIRDAFFSVSAFYRAATGAAADAKYLNACFADLDFGKTTDEEEATLRFGQALKVITDLQDRGVIPPASIIGRSGTGAWLFWLLQDEKDPSRPPGAYPEKQLEYLTIQKGLGHRIRDAAPALRPDALAIDVSRVTRVPGSMHSGAHRRVSYVAQFDDTVPSEFDYSDGMVWLRAPLFSYTLRELRDWLGVEKRPEPKMVKARSTGKTPKRRAGWVALTQQRLAEYQRVEAHRDGFQQGHRHMALFAGALFMRTLNWDEDQVEDEVEKLARRCSPPLTRTEWKDALRDGLAARGKRRWVRDETLVGWLQTTAEETETLDLHHLRHDAEYKGPYVPRTGRRLNREARLVALEELRIKIGSAEPTVRDLQELLRTKYGITVSVGTVHKDAQAIGFDFTRERPGPIGPEQLPLC